MSTINYSQPLQLTSNAEDVARVSAFFNAQAREEGHLQEGESLLFFLGEEWGDNAHVVRITNPTVFPVLLQDGAREENNHIFLNEQSLIALVPSVFRCIEQIRSGKFTVTGLML